MRQHATFFGALAIIISASLWAVDSAAIRPRLFHLDPFVVVFLEHAIAFAFMFVFFMIEIKEIRKLGKAEWMSFFWVALFGGAIGTIAITKAFFSVFLDGISSVSVVVLLQKTQPIFAILLALLILKERPRPIFYPLAILAMIGSYLVAFGFSIPQLSSDNPVLFVPLLALLAAFSFGSSTVFGKKAVAKVNFRVATYIRFGLVTIIMLATLFALGKHTEVAAVSLSDILLLVLIACTTGGAAIFLYYYGLKRVLASRATIYELSFPIVAIILDYLLHDHIMDFGQWFGTFLLLGAITLLSITRQKVSETDG